ncbi:MAG: hemerythrin domain-containing protein [Sphingopyxis sp.]|uniref:hemerythrin domain-containing protein n=1 Tax=Sphingopyxis sp. TaxID=1908224 RepID=UPI002ABC9B0F|nr:hemerythrin domain-containing protein [Sphingopyxis sp.]MDZ3830715.1 hemerythrin domain-containing protein [Sphingopyxis sp.]
MRLRDEVQRLRAEHAALASLSGLLLDLVRAAAPPRPTELLALRGLLRDTLTRHLKCEDWVLYPGLKASGDAALGDLATAFVDEMGHIASDFAAYDAKWTVAAVEADWTGFCADTEAVLHVLGVRIARENGELYPAAEALSDRMERAAS